jgi:flagellar biosynthesis protein FliR
MDKLIKVLWFLIMLGDIVVGIRLAYAHQYFVATFLFACSLFAFDMAFNVFMPRIVRWQIDREIAKDKQ